MRRAVDHVRHAHGGERAVDPLAHRVALEPEVERPERDVLGDGRHEELVVGVLEDEADRRAQVANVVLADGQARDLQLALTGQQPVEVEHQRRLAGAVGPQHGDALAVRDVQVHAVEARHAIRVPEAQPACVDRAAHAATSASTRSGTSVSTRTATKATSARRNVSTASRGIAPAYPRASIARYTRSPRS